MIYHFPRNNPPLGKKITPFFESGIIQNYQ